MALQNELIIDVNVKMNIPDETARACLNMVDIYCKQKLGDLEPGDICNGCTLLDGVYCHYKHCGVVVKEAE